MEKKKRQKQVLKHIRREGGPRNNSTKKPGEASAQDHAEDSKEGGRVNAEQTSQKSRSGPKEGEGRKKGKGEAKAGACNGLKS